ncbi:MAG: NifB/NifX family molybdenum-iron cluster-binding protein [Gemmatimonadales bacterium]|jgi:predicted Fe-Mo cluster-binding NifX family protein
MKLCIPTLNDAGLGGIPSDHFGSAPFFTYVDAETGECRVQPNGGAQHAHGACRPLDHLDSERVDAIVCRGLGRRAFTKLQATGTDVYVTLERDVGATVEAFHEGRLRKLTSEEACHGRGGGRRGHGHRHG